MSHGSRPDRPLQDRLIFYRTAPMDCSYLPGRTEIRALCQISPDHVAAGVFDRLTALGFRRNQSYLYRPICDTCQACVSVRIPVERFTGSRWTRKLRKRNAMFSETLAPALIDDEHFALFSDYETVRHPGSDMAQMSRRDLQAMVEGSPARTAMLDLRAPDGRLVATCLVDIGDIGLSAVYSFFAPDLERHSLGSELVLRLVDRARRDGLPHVYLGYWIADCRKMSYKTRFQPLEYLLGSEWVEKLPETS